MADPLLSSQWIGMLAMEPEALEGRAGVRFRTGVDDLGEFVRATLVTSLGEEVSLERHRGNPVPGTLVMATRTEATPRAVLGRVLQALGLDESAVARVPLDVDQPGIESVPKVGRPEDEDVELCLRLPRRDVGYLWQIVEKARLDWERLGLGPAPAGTIADAMQQWRARELQRLADLLASVAWGAKEGGSQQP